MPVSSTATVTPWPVSPPAASCVAPVCCRNASEGVCGPVDSVVDCTLTVAIRRHADARQRRQHRLQGGGDHRVDRVDEVVLRQDGAAQLSTAATGLSSPVAVTMTVSPGLADAAGAPASDVPAKAAAIAAATAAAARPFRHEISRAR